MKSYERLSWHTTAEQCAQIVVLAEDGINQQNIGNRLGLHQSTVPRVLRRFHEIKELKGYQIYQQHFISCLWL
jgi:IS30 family transposase